MHWKIAIFLAIVLPAMASAADDEILKNWFDDPFVQVRAGIAQCPAPRGPLMTEAEKNGESHYRAERGTSCWLAGKCAQPNAYLYDAPIVKAIQDHFRVGDAFKDASLWITVTRRFVWVEGCIDPVTSPAAIEAFIQAMPDVERVIVNVMTGVQENPPYLLGATH